MKKLQVCLVLLCALVFTFSAVAQVQNGQLQGTITDPSGASIANAKVTVTNQGTNQSVATTTNQSGNYTARELPVGSYKISIEAPGFKTTTSTGLTINAGTIQHVDFKMQLGEAREIVEVYGAVAAVNTEDSKLGFVVSGSQVANLPLNGRNIYDLVQLAPGAVNVAGVDFENGHGTVVNGLRENFSGYMINGISNKGLSGGVYSVPIQDTVQEFQELTLNNSAQYGNSAGATTNLVTKSGTNAYHGAAWEYLRNDVFDANDFFTNHASQKKTPLRFNQFGGTLQGPIIKDKLFFSAAFQIDHFRASGLPTPVLQENPAFATLVEQTFPNSVANILYSQFPSKVAGTPAITADAYVTGGNSSSGFASWTQYLCPSNYAGDPRGSEFIPTQFAKLFGYDPALDDAGCGTTLGSLGVAPNLAAVANRQIQLLDNSVAIFNTQTQSLGNLFNGKEWSAKLDYTPSSKDRFSLNYAWYRSTDSNGPLKPQGVRGFLNPTRNLYPAGQFGWTRTFTPTVINEFRAGYTMTNQLIGAVNPGIPQIAFDDASLGFGTYAGYPQFFKENIYQYSDMVSLTHGNHNLKIGGDVRRNIENSEFNVARPSYYFNDALFFAVDQPYTMTGGVDPGICKAPCSSFNQAPQGQLASNVRHWRNVEFGAFFQDDWKVTRRLTLNLGIRWDLYKRHNEENNQATTFIKGPGTRVIDNISTGAGFLQAANVPAGSTGCTTAAQMALAPLATVCGPGGFAPATSLGKGRHKDFGPRLGFAWDVFGDGKTSLRGGFGISYEGTLYNPLSNSRWNLPYYSFNNANNFLAQDVNTVIYGPSQGGPSLCPNCAVTPTFLGPAQNIGQGVGAQANGNIVGWDPTNPNLAILTGIIFPEGVSDPYVYNHYLSVQRELPGRFVVEANFVGTVGHKLFRAEDINRIPGGKLPIGACTTDNFGRQLCSQKDGAFNFSGRLNPNYGRLRVWENVVNSNYNALQLSVKKQMSHGVLLNANYTWSHTIDGGSTWHSGATTANGASGGEGFTTDQTIPSVDRGNSLFDIRHRLVLNYVIDLPGPKNGVLGMIAGGWQYSGIFSYQTGAHWQPFRSGASKLRNSADVSCSAVDVAAGDCVNKGGDFNLDAIANDRPNSNITGFSGATHDMWANGFGAAFVAGHFSAPCPGCVGNLGRNTFVGPGQFISDMTLAKTFKITEQVKLKFEAQGFNVFNRTNFILATAGGGANNRINGGLFGQAGGTLNPRQIQFGLKLSF